MYFMYGLDNIVTMFLIVIGFFIVLYAQMRISSAYHKYLLKENHLKINGCEVARKILDKNGLDSIYVVEVKGTLTDHYDPSRKVVRLSTEVFHGTSIASLAIAAHECGHAIQDKENYTFMRVRAALVPVVNFISYLGYFSLIVSIIGGLTGYIKLSILILLATIIFQLITLPVEFDASKRAKREVEQLKLSNSIEDVADMLQAAAFTYVASLISSILSLLRLILILNQNDDR